METNKRIGELEQALMQAKKMIGSLRRCITVHPDCEEGSEFDDYANSAQEIENEIDEILANKKL